MGGLAKATFIGAASAAVTFGIGEAASSLFTNFFSKAAFQAAAHGTFQGTMSGIQGANFWTGFAAGALSSIAASAWSGGTTETTGFSQENNWAYGAKTITHAGLGAGTGTAGMIAFGTVMGGAGAALTGGNFWQGAVTGLVVSGLNHGFEHGSTKEEAEQEGWVSEQQRMNYKINEFALDAVMWIDGAAELSAVKWGATKLFVKGLFSSETKILVQFGKVDNQVSHVFRHIEEMGLSREAVRSAVLKDIPRIAKNMPYGKSINTTITVANQKIIYSSYKLPNGVINVGRITGLTK